jgi:metal-dependent hydrolase (beta-lactamase superfamily II)/CubicO group peptidase (beta-lactamase class C family)
MATITPSLPTVTPPGRSVSAAQAREAGEMRITIVYDNTTFDHRLTPEWGFAAWIEYGGYTLLFDTGGDGSILLDNMALLDLDPTQIDVVVLSHNHGDHTGGLNALLDTGVRPVVYVPRAFPAAFDRSVRARTDLVEVATAAEILPGVHTTGQLGDIAEQSLVVETPEGMVLITGCAHPGIRYIIRKARSIVDGDVALVIGGFHLQGASRGEIESIIAAFHHHGVERLAPAHCTGPMAMAMFAEAYGQDYVEAGAGRTIVIGAKQETGRVPWPTEGWQTSTPEEQGVDSEGLATMLASIQEQDYPIDAVLVVRHGVLVLDAYRYPARPDSRHVVYSCTKSVVSALVGIALARGYIESTDQPLLSFFPDRQVAHPDARKDAMTLEDVLTMSTGLQCEDSYLYRWRGIQEMERSDDWVQFMLDLPMVEEPGTRFEYCNGASFLLSAIIQETTGQSALAFAQEYLFGPLGIEEVAWGSNPQGITIGWSDLHLRPHDMAKIGYLYLNGGRWQEGQLVPTAWVEASTSNHIPATLQDGYGYQWWIDDDGYYMALGYAGQFIFVVPELDMVVVFASDLPESDFYVPEQLLRSYVIPAVASTEPLPGNPVGLEHLTSLTQALANPSP